MFTPQVHTAFIIPAGLSYTISLAEIQRHVFDLMRDLLKIEA